MSGAARAQLLRLGPGLSAAGIAAAYAPPPPAPGGAAAGGVAPGEPERPLLSRTARIKLMRSHMGDVQVKRDRLGRKSANSVRQVGDLLRHNEKASKVITCKQVLPLCNHMRCALFALLPHVANG